MTPRRSSNRERVERGRPEPIDGYARSGNGLRRQAVRLAQQPEYHVLVGDMVGTADLRLGPSFSNGVARARREVTQSTGAQDVEVVGVSRHEALVRRLFADSDMSADLGPGRPGPAGLVHEIFDEPIRDLAKPAGRPYRSERCSNDVPAVSSAIT